ncbi:MAG: hypothetical protein Q7T50_00490 [Candidatus Magasanikbacteria bacterium]|nr:hypothetical protein [Candidatus Magasanikbacteria bacterium]
MKKIIYYTCIVSFVFLSACSIFDDQESTLQKRFDELSDLNDKLVEKRTEVLNLHQKFVDEIEGLESEIMTIANSQVGITYQEALENSRIHYNLKLLQQKKAYIKKLAEFHSRLMYGSEEVLFLTRKTESDLDICKVMNEEEINNLIKQIDQAINNYLPYADKLVINVDPSETETAENILRNIAQRKSGETEISKKIIAKEKYGNNYRIARLIKNGKMDEEWYKNASDNYFEVESFGKGFKPNVWKGLHEALYVNIEKIFFVKPYIVMGTEFDFNEEECAILQGYLLDANGTKYELEKIIWKEGYSPEKFFEEKKWVCGEAGEKKKVFYIFPYINPEKLFNGTLYLEGKQIIFSKQ